MNKDNLSVNNNSHPQKSSKSTKRRVLIVAAIIGIILIVIGLGIINWNRIQQPKNTSGYEESTPSESVQEETPEDEGIEVAPEVPKKTIPAGQPEDAPED